MLPEGAGGRPCLFRPSRAGSPVLRGQPGLARLRIRHEKGAACAAPYEWIFRAGAYQPRLMVWSRSGPTDTRLTRTPVSSSMRAM